MTAFRKKPVLVDAVQWTGTNAREVKAWMHELVGDQPIALLVPRRSSTMTKTLFTNVLEDPSDDVTAALWVAANDAYLGLVNGEWILHDRFGFYPCKDDGTGRAPHGYDPELAERPADPDGPFLVTDLSLNLAGPPPEGTVHPETTPVGPFSTIHEADTWARMLCDRYGGGSWSVSPLHPAVHPDQRKPVVRDVVRRGWTRHGHAIDGVAQQPPEPDSRARCGGAGLCSPCSLDAATARAAR